MAPKLTVDESLTFMYNCLKHKNAKDIDFNGVAGNYSDLKPSAARMRYYRLCKAIEEKNGGSYNGGNGKNSLTAATPSKRKGSEKCVSGSPTKQRKTIRKTTLEESGAEEDADCEGHVKEEDE